MLINKLNYKQFKRTNFNKFAFLSVCLLFFSYIGMGQTTILSEDFTGMTGTTPPAGWSNTIVTGEPNEKWAFDNPGSKTINGPITGTFAIFDSDHYGNNSSAENVFLETPAFDASTYDEVTLSYDQYFRSGYGGRIYIDVYDGTAWQTVLNSTTTTNNATSAHLNLSANLAGVSNAKIRFRWTGNWSYYWALDNIDISGLTYVDTDKDGIVDVKDLDDDNDGIPDLAEAGLACSHTVVLSGDEFGRIYEINVLTGAVTLATTSTIVSGTINALAANGDNQLAYYGSGTQILMWDPATDTHSVLADLVGKVDGEFQSGGGTYLDNFLYYASENAGGTHVNIYKIPLAEDGRSTTGDPVALDPTGITGGYGDIVISYEGSQGTLYGSTTSGQFWTYDIGLDKFTVLNSTGTVFQQAIDIFGQNWGATGTTLQRLDDNGVPYGPTIALSSETSDMTGPFNCPQPNLKLDSDGDGIPNTLDLDSDNDGIPDLVEAKGTDIDGDGFVDNNIDSDGDGVPDYADPDSPTCTFGDASSPQDGICDNVQIGPDLDNDGIADDFDLDKDGDGLLDVYDNDPTDPSASKSTSVLFDTNGDGINDIFHDTDKDGLPDYFDLDADNDGIPDVVEVGGTDENGDGFADDYVDIDMDGFNDVVDGDVGNNGTENTNNALLVTGPDTDGDGFPNSTPNGDTDKDGRMDHLDLDADNDGIADVAEAGGTDTNGDGIADNYIDADNDGFNDTVDGDPNNSLVTGDDSSDTNTSNALVTTDQDINTDGVPDSYPFNDTDGDGHLDHLDLDADNDGIPDVVEAGGTDTNGDGFADNYTDVDEDGFNDSVDGDPDNSLTVGDDSSDTNSADALLATGPDTDMNGAPDNYPNGDTDQDGNLDHLDLDADNDGIPDVVEAGGTDTNGDGFADNFTDVDEDGFNDMVDGDPDNSLPVGNDSPDTNLNNALLLTGADANNDGAPDSYATDDSDKDGKLDHLDLDADNDGIPDVVEAGGTDTNGDGRADNYTDLDNDGFNDLLDGDPNNSLATGDDSPDTNIANALLLTGTDDNNNGTPNSYPTDDTDSDGHLDYLDLDADNDGIPDVVEAGGTDTNGDGIADNYTDNDNDGFNDSVDGDPNNSLTFGDDSPDTNIASALLATGPDSDANGSPNTFPTDDMDKDGHLDYLDLDADNDGIPDVVEAGGTDVNGDGFADNYSDLDLDGFNDSVDGDPNNSLVTGDDSSDTNTSDALLLTGIDANADGAPDTYPTHDTDGDSNLDHLDLDADNDGIPDVVEAGGTDENGDGVADNYVDIDKDGFNDIVDGDPNNSLATGDDSSDSNTNHALQLTGADTNSDGAPNSYPEGDTDGDGNLDHLDLDADNDGIQDLVEAGGTDDNKDGYVDNFDPATGTFADANPDNDGFSNVYDNDTNNDGITGEGTPIMVTSADADSDGAPESLPNGDMDMDGIPNHLDIDADNDGIVDILEAGGADINGDGMVDDYNPTMPETFDTGDSDGWSATYDGDAANDGNTTNAGDGSPLITTNDSDASGFPNEYLTGDAESDSYPNFLDIDADNDGIVDNVEAQSTAGYTLPNTTTVDSDGDGLNDAYDNKVGFGGIGIETDVADNEGTPLDLDGDGTPDYLDLDTDGDNIPDVQEAWDDILDGDSKTDDIIGTCDGTDIDKDGLLDCFDSDTSLPTVTSYDTPINDMGYNGGASSASTSTSGQTPDEIFPDNGGVDMEADWRDILVDCGVPQVEYAFTASNPGSPVQYDFDGTRHLIANTPPAVRVTRATVFCEPEADGWYYFYNPLEPNNYLFAIKNAAGSPNTVHMWDLMDYIEIKYEDTEQNRYKIGSTSATLVMERDWNVVFKTAPTAGSTFDVKFYYDQEELTDLMTAAEDVKTTHPDASSTFFWFKKPGGVHAADIDASDVINSTDITSMDNNGTNGQPGKLGLTDGNAATTGNSKNYVQFDGLASFSGGTAGIKLNYAVLPVELTEFDVKVQNCESQLTWTTETEDNFDYFEIQKSENGRDFEAIGYQVGQGGTQATRYTFADKDLNFANYYRLKIIDKDGTFEYSKVKFANSDCGEAFELKIYPNPVERIFDIVNLEFFSTDTESEFSITNKKGQVVQVLKIQSDPNVINTATINVSHLAAGTYHVHQHNTKRVVTFIVIEK